MIFQPTNITPSSRGELGNGTVDAAAPLTVSWQVNGNSAMTAFSITVYRNNAASTQIYTTGKRTDNCPFYGTDSAGNTRLFSYTIPSVTGMTNGGDYKLVIRQWWSASDSVTQTSAAAFITRAAPSLTLSALPAVIGERIYTFTASYTQAQGDALNWVRWMLAYQGQEEEPLYDTGNIYGTAELSMTYDGLFRGTDYAVRCLVQTENGIEADTGWTEFSVDYDVMTLEWAVTAARVCGTGAVSVAWPKVRSIPGTAAGEYTVSDGTLELPGGSSVAWDSVNGEDMAFAEPWTLLYSASFTRDTGTFLSIRKQGGEMEVRTFNFLYDYSSRSIRFGLGYPTSTLLTDVQAYYGASIVLVLTEDKIEYRVTDYTGGTVPSSGLYPGEEVYPVSAERRVRTGRLYFRPYAGYYGTLESLTVSGEQETDYLTVLEGAASADVIQQAINDPSFEPEADETTLFLADFSNGIGGGLLDEMGGTATGFAVYRRQGTDLLHLADLPITSSALLDYGARSQQGPYTYEIFPTSQEAYLSVPIETNEVDPCFWDWSVLVCQAREAEGQYQVTAEYRFGKNLSSGSVGNNNSPFIQANFTQYPTVQVSPSNWKSGTLESLIGVIDYENGNSYSDTIDLRDAIYALSASEAAMFLKNRKGDLWMIRPAGEIVMDTMDATRAQAQSVRFPWVEVGSAEKVSLTSLPGEVLFEGGGAS